MVDDILKEIENLEKDTTYFCVKGTITDSHDMTWDIWYFYYRGTKSVYKKYKLPIMWAEK